MIQKKNQRSLQLAESVHDDFWGTGLNKVGTEHTDHRNRLVGIYWDRFIAMSSVHSRRPPRRSGSFPKNILA